jgi:hypothetical protein
MARIIGAEGKTIEAIFAEIGQGSRFVVHQYCISILIMSFKRAGAIHFLKEGERHWPSSLGCSAVSFVLGWWGIPWGPIWTVGTIGSNLAGGKDVTEEMMAALQQFPAETMITTEQGRNLAQVFE